MVKRRLARALALMRNHLVEVEVANLAGVLGSLLGALFDLFLLFVLLTAFKAFLLHLLDVVEHFVATGHRRLLLVFAGLHFWGGFAFGVRKLTIKITNISNV